MSQASHPVFGRRFAHDLWRLTRIYWSSPAAKQGRWLLALAVALELGVVYGNVLLAGSQKRIFDAVQDKQLPVFLSAIGGFLAIVIGFVLVSAYRIYVRQWLEMRWRRSVTDHYLESWIGPQAYCQRELHYGEADNPDQRISEDIRNYVASTLGLGLSLLSALATLYSFAGLLWGLSSNWPLQIGGRPVHIPGLMMWIAIVYAFIAMGLTHLVGRPLVPINFNRQKVEADFRYGLVRFRENVEAVALARGGRFEKRNAIGRFEQVMENWWQLIAAQRRLNIFTTTIAQANGIIPVLIAAPAYFAGWFTLGSVAQTRVAYVQVSGALAWFVYAYQEIAQWRASVERLSTFADVIDAARADMERSDAIRIVPSDGKSVRLVDLRLALPDGTALLERVDAELAPGERVALLGGAGIGKTTLFRALAGIWPYGTGRIEVPAGARLLFVPQRPYLPIGTIRDAVSYPSPGSEFSDDAIRQALGLLGLERLAATLDQGGPWEQHLSTEEQQRLCIARVLLHVPDWLFLDDATASLDVAMERRVYEILDERLPGATIVSLTRRAEVAALHRRCWSIADQDSGVARLEMAADRQTRHIG